MGLLELSLKDGLDMSELALREAAAADHAAKIAGEAAEQTVAATNRDISEGWAEMARDAANLALGHACIATRLSPGGPAARAAKQSADLAAASAEAAEAAATSARRD